jgi:hypothetical protein
MTMYKIFFGLVVVMVIYNIARGPSGRGEYSVGHRMGVLTKFSQKGLTGLTRSGEGRILLGKSSTESVIRDSKGDVKETVNPWSFSCEPNSVVASQLQTYAGQVVVLKYVQRRWKGYARETEYEVVEVKPVSDNASLQAVELGGKSGTSEGELIGIFIKVSQKGTINKSFEVLFQEGGTGNTFKKLSPSTRQAYAAALAYL